MRIQSVATVAASLTLVLVFAFLFNMISSSQLKAQPKIALGQEEDGKFDPIQEGDDAEKPEVWDEETEGDHHDDEEHGKEHEHEGEFEEEVEHEFMHLELEKLSIENNLVRLEFMERLTEIAKDKEATAGYAIMHLGEFIEDEGEMIEMLEKLHEAESVSDATRNLIRMKLAEAYMHADRPEKSMGVLKMMILGEQEK